MAEGLTFSTEETKIIDSPNFLIFVQGSWAPWNTPVNVAASNAVVENGLASVLLYDSWRNWEITQRQDVKEKWEWISAFDGKTYHDELAELRERVEQVRREYNPKNLFLSGNSYGGGLVALVSGDGIPDLKRVLLVSPQVIHPKGEPLNIYRSFPPIEDFRAAISRYKGYLTIVYGNRDTEQAVGLDQSSGLFEAAGTHRKTLEITHASHGFSGALALYVKAHLRAFGEYEKPTLSNSG